MQTIVILAFAAACAVFGYRAISAVPPLLHTPLMSGMNALSGITLLAALALLGREQAAADRILTVTAGILAATNVAGGFWVTERMLRMFKRTGQNSAEDTGHD